MSKTPILITGCQRSGTTLMRLVMNAHPDVLSIDEDRFHYPSILTYLNAPWLPEFVCFKLPQYAPVLPFLESLPDGKILWCIRHPLDVAWSMLKLRMNHRENQTLSWAAHPGCAQQEIVNGYWSLDPEAGRVVDGFMGRFEVIANKEPQARDRNDEIFLSALCWTIKNALPERYRQEGIGFHAIGYETLVENPENVIRAVLDYVGAGWSDDVLKHHEKSDGVSIGNTVNTRPIDSRGVGQGVKNFTPDEVGQIRQVCGAVAARWDYRI